jgi:hypothetical protein
MEVNTMLDYNTEQNLIQISSLKNARIKNDFNLNLLHKRMDMAKREVRTFRRMADNLEQKQLSQTAIEHCRTIADLIESRIS